MRLMRMYPYLPQLNIMCAIMLIENPANMIGSYNILLFYGCTAKDWIASLFEITMSYVFDLVNVIVSQLNGLRRKY